MAKGEKHSLVQCRIEACQKVDEIVKEKDCSVVDAMKELAGAQGVPFGTLNFWYYRDDESKKGYGKVQVPEVPKSTAKVKAKVINKIVENIAKAREKDEEAAMATAQGQAAKELADGLGGNVLAEELYELYLKKIDEVSKVISANRELTEPMNMDRVIDQLLRLARNAGWIKTVVEEPVVQDTTKKCTKCVIKSCPNKMCDNHKPKKDKKKVKAKLPLRLPKKAKKGGK
jgi:hypothetical protein